MIFTFEEAPESRQETFNPPTYTLVYKACGEQDDDIVADYALAATPTVVFRPTAHLYRKDVRKDPVGWANYLVTVTYEKRDTNAGSFSFSFDTSGATIKVKAAKRHVATYNADGLASGNWHKGAIGVKPDGDVEGVDIVIPGLKLTYSFKHPEGVVDEAFARRLARATGYVNSDEFRGFQPGELLFIGATGSDGSDAEAEVGYQLIASENAEGLTIGEIADIAKKGHEALWIEFEPKVEAGNPVHQPKRIHIEEVYGSLSFADAFGWS